YEVATIDVSYKQAWWKPKKKETLRVKRSCAFWRTEKGILPQDLELKVYSHILSSVRRGNAPVELMW
ncbi:MAG TPA: hypothetical protein VFM18_16240, partial [Methanosarcina sp.]|nr:hypothetical protein [Methanosarcina sp.]